MNLFFSYVFSKKEFLIIFSQEVWENQIKAFISLLFHVQSGYRNMKLSITSIFSMTLTISKAIAVFLKAELPKSEVPKI